MTIIKIVLSLLAPLALFGCERSEPQEANSDTTVDNTAPVENKMSRLLVNIESIFQEPERSPGRLSSSVKEVLGAPDFVLSENGVERWSYTLREPEAEGLASVTITFNAGFATEWVMGFAN